MTLTAGELCAGYGGLQMAVEEVFGARTAWVSEYDAAPSKILAHHWPNVPNLGDMTRIDWATVEPVDIISGGTPCQDLSHAGKRAGMSEGTRSNLWVQMREAIAVIRPQFVVWENVRGAYSAAADSDMEPHTGCVGDGSGVHLRALGRVLGDLSSLGYDCAWHGLTAASVGAPHGRFRVFVLAWSAADAARDGWREGWPEPARLVGGPDAPERGDAATDTGSEASPLRAGLRPDGSPRLGGPRSDHGDSDASDTDDTGHQGPQPTPGHVLPDGGAPADACGDGWGRGRTTALSGGAGTGRPSAEPDGRGPTAIDWGIYRPAIRRWELVLGRAAPPPTEPTRKGSQRLSPRFCEWLMGLPAGHVTDPAIGLTRNEQLKALGNGVVSQQAAAALRHLLAATATERAA